MNRQTQSTIKYLPFAGIIVINILAGRMDYDLGRLTPFLLVICAVVLLDVLLAIRMKTLSYFSVGVSSMLVLETAAVFFIPPLRQVILENFIAGLYIGLFIVAFFPPLLKMDPFTYEFSKKDYPELIWSSKQFKVINLILNYIWAGIFIVTIILSLLKYSENRAIQQILLNVLPIALLLVVGVPITKRLPGYLQGKIKRDPIQFQSIKNLFQMMPFGMNKTKASGIDTVVQFRMTGEETVDGYFTIKDQTCSYTEGIHPNPATVINTPSKLWLDISNGKESGEKAFINKWYTVEGDFEILLKFQELFSNADESAQTVDTTPASPNSDIEFIYATTDPHKIKKILAVDGGSRHAKFSKSTLMAKKFCEGAEAAGAEVEYIRLKEKKIAHCSGCYTCWSKTPGVCRYKDDMPELLVKLREADLVVYVTPLFIYSVNARLKTFLDRSIPNIKPYMVAKEGVTYHPKRYEELKDRRTVVFSAGGFPEVKGNFDGISTIFRSMSHHVEKNALMGEFYMPAAEMLSQPAYKARRDKIENACFQAGKEAVEKGTIEREYMDTVADPEVSQEKFQELANMFWESMDGKMAFYKAAHPLF